MSTSGALDPPPDQLWVQRDIPGKGRGLIATQNIVAGTRFLVEDPIAVVGSGGFRTVTEAYNSVSPEKRAAWDQLAPQGPGVTSEKRWKVNNFGDPEHEFLLSTISMLNHSCCPNCEVYFDDCQGSLAALQDIAIGDELTVSYIDDLSTRKTWLYNMWGFQCRCPACEPATHGA